jgi:tetratricopeptide (TPR) repeat protein
MNSDDIANILDRANDLLEAGKPAETLRCLAQIAHALLEEDDRIEAATLRAWALSEMGRHDAALTALDELMDEYPDAGRLHAARGVVLSNADDLDEARAELEHAYMLDPEDGVTVANLALVYEKLRNYDEALALYDRALERGADIDWTLQRRAAVQAELGDTTGAKQSLRRYLSLVPEDAVQWVALGVLYSDDDEYDPAFQCYEEAAKLEPESPWLRLNWGIAAVRAGRRDMALAQCEVLRRTATETSWRWLLEAFIFEEDENAAGATAAYERALAVCDALDPEDLSYTIEMAIDYYGRLGQRDRCEELLRRAYAANACAVELCEAYREISGTEIDEATWFSLVLEADYRAGLDEVSTNGAGEGATARRYLRNFQVIARDRDEATALVTSLAERMGESHARVREFINDEPVTDTFTGLYEIERKSMVVYGGDERGQRPRDQGI